MLVLDITWIQHQYKVGAHFVLHMTFPWLHRATMPEHADCSEARPNRQTRKGWYKQLQSGKIYIYISQYMLNVLLLIHFHIYVWHNLWMTFHTHCLLSRFLSIGNSSGHLCFHKTSSFPYGISKEHSNS